MASILQGIVVSTLEKLIFSTISKTLRRSSTPVAPVNVGPVATKVAQDLAPIIEHATNTEPWFRSRVTWGSLGSVVVALGSIITMFSEGSFDVATFSANFAILLGGGLALWGRWVSKKPIGK